MYNIDMWYDNEMITTKLNLLFTLYRLLKLSNKHVELPCLQYKYEEMFIIVCFLGAI